jgi:hypothetical protein
MLLLRSFHDDWMTQPSHWNILDLISRRGLNLGKGGGESSALFRHAFDQKPAAMTVKNMFHQR